MNYMQKVEKIVAAPIEPPSDKITIDLAKIAEHMVDKGGISPSKVWIHNNLRINDGDLAGWTDALVDALQDGYAFETKLADIFKWLKTYKARKDSNLT